MHGGGKISQRFWEYFIAIEMLGLGPDAVVLDIGGGSPATGVSMFPQLLAASGIRTIVLDNDFGRFDPGTDSIPNVTLEKGFADRETLGAQLAKHKPTHISCISVLEHASVEQQRGIFDAIEAHFDGIRAVFTFEFHEIHIHFERQLTTKMLSDAVSGLRRYYLERIESSPTHCVNVVRDNKDRLWFPLALQFDRMG